MNRRLGNSVSSIPVEDNIPLVGGQTAWPSVIQHKQCNRWLSIPDYISSSSRALHKKSPYSELFWSTFCRHFPAFGLNTERYYVFTCLSVFSPNAVKCGKYADQNNSEYGLFLRSDVHCFSHMNLFTVFDHFSLSWSNSSSVLTAFWPPKLMSIDGLHWNYILELCVGTIYWNYNPDYILRPN